MNKYVLQVWPSFNEEALDICQCHSLQLTNETSQNFSLTKRIYVGLELKWWPGQEGDGNSTQGLQNVDIPWGGARNLGYTWNVCWAVANLQTRFLIKK